MNKTEALDEAVNNLKQLVVLYGEITEELIDNLEEANSDIERLREKNENLENDNNVLSEKCDNLDKKYHEEMKKIAELKQKKTPSIDDIIAKLMNEIQLLKVEKQNVSQDLDDNGNGHEEKSEEERKENPVFDLRKDKASDEDGFD